MEKKDIKTALIPLLFSPLIQWMISSVPWSWRWSMDWWLSDLSPDTGLAYPNAFLKLFEYQVDISNLTQQNLPSPTCSSWSLSSPIKWQLQPSNNPSLLLENHSWILFLPHIISHPPENPISSSFKISLGVQPLPSTSTTTIISCLIVAISYNSHHSCWKEMASPNGVTKEILIRDCLRGYRQD